MLYFIQSSPYLGRYAQDGLEMLMSSVAFGVETKAIFIHDGIYQLLENQSPEPFRKNIQKQLTVLPMYDIEAVYYMSDHLELLGLKAEQLLPIAKPITHEQIQQEIKSATKVVLL